MWDRKKDVLLTWLEEVLCRVENSENDMSYTRRSAGIPSIIQVRESRERGEKGRGGRLTNAYSCETACLGFVSGRRSDRLSIRDSYLQRILSNKHLGL